MLPYKVHKHATIFGRRLKQGKTARQIAAEGHPTLSTLLRCIERARTDQFTVTERADFAAVETYRAELLKNDELVDYSVFNLPDTATVSSVCRQATSPSIWARLLYLLADELQAERVLEMGTNLGVSGSYLLQALKKRHGATLTTMDGVPKYVEIAGRQFSRIADADRYEIILGNYDDTFPRLLQRQPDFDLLFIDGNHREKPTVDYFRGLLPHVRRPSVWIFDDINWTPGMVNAWETIRNDPAVTYSIDLWKLGILLVDQRSNPGKKHFALHLTH